MARMAGFQELPECWHRDFGVRDMVDMLSLEGEVGVDLWGGVRLSDVGYSKRRLGNIEGSCIWLI
jgi:hypothetical protein